MSAVIALCVEVITVFELNELLKRNYNLDSSGCMLFVEWVEETKDLTKKQVVKGIIEQSGRITLSESLTIQLLADFQFPSNLNYSHRESKTGPLDTYHLHT